MGGVVGLITRIEASEAVDAMRPLGGRSLWLHSVEQLREAMIDRIVVDSNDERIAAEARRWSVEALDLRNADSAARWAHASDKSDIVSLDWRYPLRTAADVAALVHRIREHKASCVILGIGVGAGAGGIFRYEGAPREGRVEPIERSAGGYVEQFVSMQARAGREVPGRSRTFVQIGESCNALRADTDEGFAAAEAVFMLRSRAAITAALREIELVVFDFDGVFTDNRVVVHEDGTEAVLCNRSDGLGIGMLRDAGVRAAVLTAERNPAPLRRCEKLKIPCVQVEKHKLPALEKMLAEMHVAPARTAFVGNDVNDLPCMEFLTRRGGVAIAVFDAHPKVRAETRIATRLRGGEGAVREVIDWILEARKPHPE